MSKKARATRDGREVRCFPVPISKMNDTSDVEGASTSGCSGGELSGSESGSAFKIILRRKVSPDKFENRSQTFFHPTNLPQRRGSLESISIMQNKKFNCSDYDTDGTNSHPKYAQYQQKKSAGETQPCCYSVDNSNRKMNCLKPSSAVGFNNGELPPMNTDCIGFKSITNKPLGQCHRRPSSVSNCVSAYNYSCGQRSKSGCDCNCMKPLYDQFFTPGCDPCKPYGRICKRPSCKSKCESCSHLEQCLHSCCRTSNCEPTYGSRNPCNVTCSPCMMTSNYPCMATCNPYQTMSVPYPCQIYNPRSTVSSPCQTPEISPPPSRKNSSLMIDQNCTFKFCKKRSDDYLSRIQQIQSRTDSKTIQSAPQQDCLIEDVTDKTSGIDIDSNNYDVWIVQCPKHYDINGVLNRLSTAEGKSMLGKNIEPNVESYNENKLFTMYCKVDAKPENTSFMPAGKIIFKEREDNSMLTPHNSEQQQRQTPSTFITAGNNDLPVKRVRNRASNYRNFSRR